MIRSEIEKPARLDTARKRVAYRAWRGAMDRYGDTSGEPDTKYGGNVQRLVRNVHMHRFICFYPRRSERRDNGKCLFSDVAAMRG